MAGSTRMRVLTNIERFGSGRAVPRTEDDRPLRGHGEFTDDLAPGGVLRAAFVRSPFPQAPIVSIDTARAATLSGVVSVVTGAELAALGVHPIAPLTALPNGSLPKTPESRVLASGRVRFVGEAVAMVVAETIDRARDAA